MATITINVPARDASEYLREIFHQIRDGCGSGHTDRDTNWDVTFDAGESIDTLA